jgi:hypothetical protein
MRLRNPWTRARRWLFGWKVRFMMIHSGKCTAIIVSMSVGKCPAAKSEKVPEGGGEVNPDIVASNPPLRS